MSTIPPPPPSSPPPPPPSSPPPPLPPPWSPEPQSASNDPAIASLVCGILGIILSVLCFPVGIGVSIAAIITGYIGRRRSARLGGAGRGQATGGLATGVVGLVLSALVVAVLSTVLISRVDLSEDGTCDADAVIDPDC